MPSKYDLSYCRACGQKHIKMGELVEKNSVLGWVAYDCVEDIIQGRLAPPSQVKAVDAMKDALHLKSAEIRERARLMFERDLGKIRARHYGLNEMEEKLDLDDAYEEMMRYAINP
jgi:hypothetical protein